MNSPIPLSLYIHFPWCVQKCPYCDFNSHALRGQLPEDAYVDALLRDLDWELASTNPESRIPNPDERPLVSIFMGGGTPSLFSGAAIARVLAGVRECLAFAPDIEITLEANPGTADASNFAGYRAAGVNRLSIGVQSLDPQQLKRLGRIHDPAEARHAVALARAAGFENLNLDLMFALPDQTLDAALDDLHGALALAPEHLSWYQLTIEPNTEFAARPPALPDNDAASDITEAGQALLAQYGYAQYEVSAYAKPGRPSRHNLNYWEFGDYLGIGAGAHGKRSLGGGIERRARQRHPRSFQESAGSAACVQEHRRVTAAELPFEYCMNALRLNRGFALADFERRTGLPASALNEGLAQARRQGLIEEAGGCVQPSALGRQHLNRLMGLFL
ncbi:MAG TPA: radical SAM family heme chaperone HemW [Solimonas sp.]|nr:radical SAM family heme chaperone HemW [Solimonas sp.]